MNKKPLIKPSSKKPTSSVRIIAGDYRRRQLAFVDAEGLRPTPDRVRETLFNWLTDRLPNARVLDCCAGSGVLGFEALSRGAATATLIEPNAEQFRQLQASQAMLNIPTNRLLLHQATAQTVLSELGKTNAAFEVIFIDPPYALELWQPILKLVIEQNLLATDGVIYLEADRPHEVILSAGEIGDILVERLSPIRNKKMGGVYAGLYALKPD